MKNVTLNSKKVAILIIALNAAGIQMGTLVSYFLDLVFGGPNHDWGNAISSNIRGVVDKLEADPLGWTLNVAVDVGVAYAAFALVGYLVTMFGGKKSIQIAKGVTWKFL